jgi:hypothetical protein
MTKTEMINVLADQFDPDTIIARDHARQTLWRLNVRILGKMLKQLRKHAPKKEPNKTK